ncbi:MAG: GNAT family N-acetyltransferase [Oscillospiraceae bacterium]|nr:GNAT family N-acetyltransferase [Oscillospiraceae bacterium]MDE7172143.1 GNAT family N-acetyltransferase [Oscillospiraceae bacterium]
MRLETDRLIVRDFTMDDLPALWDIFRDEEAMEHMAPMTQRETEEFLRSFCVARTPPGAFAAQLREVGLVGYVLFNQVDAPGIYELGWVFRRDCWGRGLAREASEALLNHAFTVLDAHKVIAQTEDTVRAVPLLERLGLRREGTFRRHGLGRDGNWKDIHWYGLLREEYANGTD